MVVGLIVVEVGGLFTAEPPELVGYVVGVTYVEPVIGVLVEDPDELAELAAAAAAYLAFNALASY